MAKKFVSAALVLIITIGCLCISAFSESVMPRMQYTDSASSVLTISGTTATCESKAIGYSGETTKIVINQTLQKKTSSGVWSTEANWSETDTGYKGSAINTKSGLSSGTYRLKTEFKVYCGVSYEIFEKISTEKTV